MCSVLLLPGALLCCVSILNVLADILVGVGLGCLLQMTSSQPLVKVRLW